MDHAGASHLSPLPSRKEKIGTGELFLLAGNARGTSGSGRAQSFPDAERAISDSRQFAIVTGAPTGIGLELARCCAQNNFDLLIAADEPEIETAAASLRSLGAAVDAVEADLSTLEACEERSRASPVETTGSILGRITR